MFILTHFPSYSENCNLPALIASSDARSYSPAACTTQRSQIGLKFRISAKELGDEIRYVPYINNEIFECETINNQIKEKIITAQKKGDIPNYLFNLRLLCERNLNDIPLWETLFESVMQHCSRSATYAIVDRIFRFCHKNKALCHLAADYDYKLMKLLFTESESEEKKAEKTEYYELFSKNSPIAGLTAQITSRLW